MAIVWPMDTSLSLTAKPSIAELLKLGESELASEGSDITLPADSESEMVSVEFVPSISAKS
jgi:hypothetical protein